MKWIFALVAALCLATPANAGTKHDVFGHRYEVDDATAITPGAGSAMGAVTGAALDSSALYVTSDWDLTLGMLATGDEEPGQEYALASLTVWKFIGREVKLGLDLSRDFNVSEIYSVTPMFKFYIFTDPVDSWSKSLKLSLGSYRHAVGGDTEALEGGGFALEPSLMAGAEWPVGGVGTIEVAAGLKETMTTPDENPPDKTQALLGFGFNLWLSRP